MARIADSSPPSYRAGASNCRILTTSKALAPIEPVKPVADAAATRCTSVGSRSPAMKSRAIGYTPLVQPEYTSSRAIVAERPGAHSATMPPRPSCESLRATSSAESSR